MSTTLLAVDDSATMRKVLEITFSGEEFRIVTADSPNAALTKLRSEKPALVLVDVTLPGQDGYALCKTLKAENPATPVIILSSKQGPYDAAKGSAAGADDYADKPFDTQQIIEKVKKAIAAKAAAPKAAEAPAAPAAPAAPPSPPVRAGGGTLPGSPAVTPPAAAQVAPRSSGPSTQAFGSPAPNRVAPTSTQPGTGPSRPTPPDNPRTRTSSGLGEAAAQAQTQNRSTTPEPAAKPEPAAAQAPAAPAAPSPVASAPTAPASPIAMAVDGQLSGKLAGLGLTSAQAEAVLALSREVVERVVWEVVPVLAETLIKEEIKRLTSE